MHVLYFIFGICICIHICMCISMSVFVSLILWKLSQVFQTQHVFLYLYLNLYLQLCSVLWKLSSVSDTTTVFSCFPTWPPLHLQLLFIGAFCRRVNTSGLISPQFARQVFAPILSTLNIQIWTKERKRGLMSKAYLKVNLVQLAHTLDWFWTRSSSNFRSKSEFCKISFLVSQARRWPPPGSDFSGF